METVTKAHAAWKLWMWRAAIEVGGIVFLFYSNLLMGEFSRNSPPDRTLVQGLHNILTGKSFAIALTTAGFGFVVLNSFARGWNRPSADIEREFYWSKC